MLRKEHGLFCTLISDDGGMLLRCVINDIDDRPIFVFFNLFCLLLCTMSCYSDMKSVLLSLLTFAITSLQVKVPIYCS